MQQQTEVLTIKNWTLYRMDNEGKITFHIEGHFKNRPEIIVPFVSVYTSYENIYAIEEHLNSPYMEVKQIPKYAHDLFVQTLKKEYKTKRGN